MVRCDSRKLGKNSPPQLQWKPTPKSSERSWKRSLQLSKSDNEPCPSCHPERSGDFPACTFSPSKDASGNSRRGVEFSVAQRISRAFVFLKGGIPRSSPTWDFLLTRAAPRPSRTPITPSPPRLYFEVFTSWYRYPPPPLPHGIIELAGIFGLGL